MRQIRGEQARGALSNLAVKQQLLQKLLKLLTGWFVLVCSMTECFPVTALLITQYSYFFFFKSHNLDSTISRKSLKKKMSEKSKSLQ